MLRFAAKPIPRLRSCSSLRSYPKLPRDSRIARGIGHAGLLKWGIFAGIVMAPAWCAGQVFTVGAPPPGSAMGNLATVHPTSVQLQKSPMTTQTKEEMIRLFQSEQAFAVRPLPLGTHGLGLHANGMLDPSGPAYAQELERDGISSKPGDRVMISKFEIKQDRIVFEFNGGPDKHHRILQHIEIGDSGMPLAPDDGQLPVGSRFTLLFDKFVPEMDAAQLRNLISPILDFSLKTPDQAFADTLPPKLKAAILDHQILVGMNRDMVIHAVGRPDRKVREMEGDTPIEIWIYGQPPHEVQFVRFHGNRVVRLEIADIGQPLVVRDQDETGGYDSGQFVHEVRLGDAPSVDSNQEQAPAAAPTLRKPGEALPDATDQQQQLKKVQFPKDSEPPEIPAPPGQDSDNLPPAGNPPTIAPPTPASHSSGSAAPAPAAPPPMDAGSDTPN